MAKPVKAKWTHRRIPMSPPPEFAHLTAADPIVVAEQWIFVDPNVIMQSDGPYRFADNITCTTSPPCGHCWHCKQAVDRRRCARRDGHRGDCVFEQRQHGGHYHDSERCDLREAVAK